MLIVLRKMLIGKTVELPQDYGVFQILNVRSTGPLDTYAVEFIDREYPWLFELNDIEFEDEYLSRTPIKDLLNTNKIWRILYGQ